MHQHEFSLFQRLLFMGLLVIVTGLFVWALWPFSTSIFWALVFAIILHPVCEKVTHRTKRPTLAALLTIFGALVVIGVPLYLVGVQTAHEGIALYHRLASGNIDVRTFTRSPLSAGLFEIAGIDPGNLIGQIGVFAREAAQRIVAEALSIGVATASTGLKIAITLYLLFYFLRDGTKLGRYLQRIIPLNDDREQLLFARFASTTRAIFKGTFIVALAQGAVGGILFLIAGIDGAVLWAVLMAFCATIPAIGSFVVWLPAALILFLMGSAWQGLVVLLGGIFIVGTIDNILRPVLVGRDIQMPDPLVLLAILGGVSTFGVAGIIIGPVIAALFISIWDLFGRDLQEVRETKP